MNLYKKVIQYNHIKEVLQQPKKTLLKIISKNHFLLRVKINHNININHNLLNKILNCK